MAVSFRISCSPVGCDCPRATFRQKLNIADQGELLPCPGYSFDVVNGIRGLDLGGDGLAGEGLDEDLRRRWRTNRCVRWDLTDKNKGQLTGMKGGLLLNVVVGEGTAILELLAGEDQALLVGRHTLLVLIS